MDIPAITAAAQKLLEQPKAFADRICFDQNQKRLHLKWSLEKRFRGSASLRGDADFDITLSYEAAVCIWQDAMQMGEQLKMAPGILAMLRLDESKIIQTPSQPLDLTLITTKLFELPLKWLFYHELGHIIEGHRELPEAGHIVTHSVDALHINDFEASAENPTLTGQQAWISHCLEIAADYQAARFLLRSVYALQNRISELDLWATVAGVVCLLYRFHGQHRGDLQAEANGSHPDPASRFDFFTTNVIHMATDQTCPWAARNDRVVEIIHHASVFAANYWQNFRLIRLLHG